MSGFTFRVIRNMFVSLILEIYRTDEACSSHLVVFDIPLVNLEVFLCIRLKYRLLAWTGTLKFAVKLK